MRLADCIMTSTDGFAVNNLQGDMRSLSYELEMMSTAGDEDVIGLESVAGFGFFDRKR
jgi:hypothetical protein